VVERLGFFDRAAPTHPFLDVSTPHGDFRVSATDASIGRSLYAKRDRPEFRVLRRAVARIERELGPEALGGAIVDVGANIGTTTIPALRTHGFASAVACEPLEGNYALLRENIARNGLDDRVTTVPNAVSDRSGTAQLTQNPGFDGHGWIAPPAPDAPAVEVELVTIDGLVDRGIIDPERTALLWIDTEGHEGHVLRGASRLTERGVPVVLELHPAGMVEHGDPDALFEGARRYSHFVDVRHRRRGGAEREGRPRPIGQLRSQFDELLDESSPPFFTDLLLLRVPG
jgi:FkbM family methyltransferase